MMRLTLASLWAHKARMVMTGLAVALGVAFVVGTLVFSDTIHGAFEDVFAAATENVDVTVEAQQEFSGAFSEDQGAGVPAEVVDEIAAIDGVESVEAEVSGFAQMVVDGEPVGGGGPPTIGVNPPSDETLRQESLRDGRFPEEGGEVAIDVGTAEEHGLAVGDTVGVMTRAEPEDHAIVGLIGYGEAESMGAITVVVFDTETAMGLYSSDGDLASVTVAAADGVSASELRDRIATAVGDDFTVRTGEEAAADAAATMGEALGFLTTGLLVFAGISLFVGAFIIANTFTIVMAQRTRELALLRAVGASRRQVMSAMLSEAVGVGLVGSMVGVGLGIGLARGLQAVLDAFGAGPPTAGLVIGIVPVLVGVLVGVGVTAVSAVAPAVRATRIAPVAALAAAAAPPPPKGGSARLLLGGVVTLLGLGALALGLFADAGITMVGVGAGVLLIGVALLASLVARPVLTVVGWPVARLLAIRGELARENALRNPRRTAATASALMIGLGLVTFAAIFGASLTRSADQVIEDSFRAEYVVRGSMQATSGLSDELAPRLAALDEVEAASATKFTELRHEGSSRFAAGVDPATIEETVSFGSVEGDLTALEGGGLALHEDAAESAGLSLGDQVEISLPRSGTQVLAVEAVFDAQNDLGWVLDHGTVVDGNREAPDQQIFVKLVEGIDVAEARPALEGVVDGFPAASLLDQAEQREEISSQVNQLLRLLSGLLLLSVLIALFGIVNTLSLSVFERRAELGLLRAVGASRRQVRAMVRWESVLISLLGAVLGLAVGVLFGWLVVRALADEGLSHFSVPGAQLALGFVAAAVAGVLAAVFPARRASRVDVLKAIAAE